MTAEFASPSPGRRSAIAALATCAVLVAPLPMPVGGWALVPVAVLVGLDVVLVSVTGGLAFAMSHRLDERQAWARDRAFRLAFRLAALAICLVLVASILGFQRRFALLVDSRFVKGEGIDARFLVTTLELLIMMPTLVLAMSGGATTTSEPTHVRGPMVALLLGVCAAALTAVAWVALVAAGPSQVTTQRNYPGITSATGALCADYLSRDEVGLGLAGPLRMRAEVCWNGKVAFVLGAGLDAPPQVPDYARMFPVSAGAVCGVDLDRQDLVRVADVRCSETVDADGTMHYAASSRAYPGPLTIGGRDERMVLVVTRDGRVLEFARN